MLYGKKDILDNLIKYSRPNYDEAILVITRMYYVNEQENYNIWRILNSSLISFLVSIKINIIVFLSLFSVSSFKRSFSKALIISRKRYSYEIVMN